MTSRPRIVLDCDPGVDDAFAILTASRHCELTAITTVAGNVAVEHTTRNALGITEVASIDVPVFRGAAGPITGAPFHDARHVHGDTGLGGVEFGSISRDIAGDDAVGALFDATAAGDVAVVAIGPLTNIAAAVLADPSWVHRVPRLVIMGGSTGAGNVTAAAEFNIWADPEAADIVFSSGAALTMAGLNLTQQVRMGEPEVAAMRASGSASARLCADALEFYMRFALDHYGVPKSAMHDPCAVLEVARPDLFERRPMHVVVETDGRHTRGMTLCDARARPDEPNVDVLVTADAGPVVELILDAVIAPVWGGSE